MARARLSTLDGSLLVRKGEAKPSPFKPAMGEAIDWYAVKQATAASFYEKFERKESAAALDRIKGAMAAPPPEAEEPPLREVAEPAPRPAPPPEPSPALDFGAAQRRKHRERTFGRATGKGVVPAEKRAALTLRLDSDRHLRLKIYSAYVRRKIQDVLVAALDDYLARQASGGGCACLQGQSRDTGT